VVVGVVVCRVRVLTGAGLSDDLVVPVGRIGFGPANIMCSKKWAKPDLPGSTSFREPVWTGI
jgi:hypothetical protein